MTPTQAFRDQITNPAIASIFNTYYPLPNAGNPSVYDETGTVAWNGQYAWAEPDKFDSQEYTVKVDYAHSENHSFYGRYFTNIIDSPAVGNLPGTTIGVYQFTGRSHAYAVDWTWLMSPTLVNNVKVGGNTTNYVWDRDDPTGPGDVIFNGGWAASYPLATDFGFFAYGDQSRRTGTFNVKDTVTWTRGNHNIKFGIDFRWIHDNGESNFQLHPALHVRLTISTNGSDNMGRNVMSGLVDSFYQSAYGNGLEYIPGFGDLRGWREREYDFFIQDDWKISPKLMLNVGLRYELKPTPYEVNGILSNVLTSEVVSQGYRIPNNDNFFDEDNWVGGDWTTLTPSQWVGPGADIFLDSSSQRIYNAHKSNFAPRFGFSYDPFGDGKTAIRAGYGISFDRLCDNLLSWNSAQMPFGFTAADSAQQTGYDGIYPNGVAYYFNGVTAPPPSLHPGPETWASQVIYNSDLNQAYMQTWNISVQRELWPGNIFTVAYAGSSGTHLLIRNNPNTMPTPSAELIQGLEDNGYVYQGGAYIPWFVRYYSVQNTQWLTLHYVNSDGHSRYDSAQFSFSRRFQDGLQLQLNYTWAKAFDNGSDSIYTDGGHAPFQSNWYNRRYDKGFAAFDVRHNFNASFIYELPFGAGKWVGGDADGIVNQIIGGWQINGIVYANTGYPLDYKVPIDTLGTGYTNDRGPSRPDVTNTNVTTDGNLVGPTQSNFVWTSATRNQLYPLGYQGGYYKGFFRQPAYWNVDFSLFKDIALPWFTAEGSKLQLRFEAFNLFNHTNFNAPSRTFTSSNMGKTFGAAANRQVQIGVKFIF